MEKIKNQNNSENQKTVVIHDNDPDGDHTAMLLMAFFGAYGIKPWDPDANKKYL